MVFEWTDADGDTHRTRLDPSLDPSDPGWLTEIERDAREFDATLPELRMPGTGAEYGDCGDDMPVALCDDCLDRTWAGRTCRRSACPRCNESWAYHGAKTDASKSEALRRKRNVVENTNKNKQHHTVFSASRSLRFDSREPLNRAKELVKHLAAGIGLDAGTIYYHPYRIKKEYRGDVNGHASGDGDLTWADILNKIEGDNGWSWEAIKYEFLIYAPHFHVIGTAKFVQGGAVTEAISEQTGFVIHRITKEDSAVSIYDQDDLCRATAYCRTHTGLQWDEENEEFRAAVWRYGESANLEPSDEVKQEIDATMRDVSLDVLGVDFSRSDECTSKVPVENASDSDETPAASNRPSPSPSPVSASGPADDRSLGPSDAGLPDGAAMMTDGGETWDETRGVAPDYLDEPIPGETTEDQEQERCGGNIVPMKFAPMYFEDPELQEAMPERIAALREDYKIWQEGGRIPPD